MKDENKTKKQLVNELIELRKLIAESQKSITERKQIEDELRIKDWAIESSINGIGIADLQGYLTYANKAFFKMWGYDEKEVLGKHVLNFCRKEDKVSEVIEALQDEGWVCEMKARRKDGSLFDVSVSSSVVKNKDDNPICMMASFIDITERKRAEEAMKKSKARLTEAQRIAHLGNWDWDIEKNELYWSDEIYRILGLSPQEFGASYAKRLKELQGNSPNKTDRKDPKVIADIIELGHALTVIIPEGTVAELRRLTQARERSIQRMSMLMSQLQDLIFLIFPEFMTVMKDITIKSTQYILKNYPRPHDVVEAGVEFLTQILKKVSRGKLGKERAEALYWAAKESIGLGEGRESIVLEIKETVSAIESIERFIKELKKHMSKHLKDVPYSRCILSMKGIGEITASGLIGEMGDFKKYRTIAEVIKHAGLDLFEISSGKHKGTRRISKRGRPLLRKLLFFASINVVRKGGILHKQYRHHLEKGMPKIKALIAISRKLLSIIFALVRDHSVYIAQYSKTQQLKEAA